MVTYCTYSPLLIVESVVVIANGFYNVCKFCISLQRCLASGNLRTSAGDYYYSDELDDSLHPINGNPLIHIEPLTVVFL